VTSATDAPELEAIARFWGHAYTFSYHPDDHPDEPYDANRKDGHGTTRAATPALLLDAIKDDAGTHPIAPAHAITPAPRCAAAPPTAPSPRLPASRYASAQLGPQPAAPAQARQLTRDCLARWDMRALTADAEAIASEIVTNALAAVSLTSAGLTIIYAIHASPPGLHIHVWDIGPGQPRPARAGSDAESGRGLAIINALTNGNWGWWPTPESGGKVVHATLTGRNAKDTPA
jgi:hypothetical protein